MGLYMIVSFITLGGSLYFILEKIFPGSDPIVKLSEFLVYWVLYEMVLRYFMQKLPVMNIKPLLPLPISKSKITNYVLVKSALSFFNFLPLFAFVPFVVVLLINDYPMGNALGWFSGIVFIILLINYINFIINKSDKVFVVIVTLIAGMIALEYFDILAITQYGGKLFYALFKQPLYALVPLLLALAAYRINFKHLYGRLFLDASLQKKTQEAKTSDLTWTSRFGDIAPFLQLDLKLIWRNKRPKMQAIISFAFILYGLFIYSSGMHEETQFMLALVGILITGIFMINFGQFIPAWDSAYYSMMMAQNIPLRKYLDSKAGLMTVSIVFMFVISIPYVYFGWEVLAVNAACALYNVGVNIPVILFFGSMNKKRINLEKSSFSNMQGMGAAQWLVGIPLMAVPMLIFVMLQLLISLGVAIIALSIMGIVGLVFRKKLMTSITNLYRTKKYAMVHGFKEQSS